MAQQPKTASSLRSRQSKSVTAADFDEPEEHQLDSFARELEGQLLASPPRVGLRRSGRHGTSSSDPSAPPLRHAWMATEVTSHTQSVRIPSADANGASRVSSSSCSPFPRTHTPAGLSRANPSSQLPLKATQPGREAQESLQTGMTHTTDLTVKAQQQWRGAAQKGRRALPSPKFGSGSNTPSSTCATSPPPSTPFSIGSAQSRQASMEMDGDNDAEAEEDIRSRGDVQSAAADSSDSCRATASASSTVLPGGDAIISSARSSTKRKSSRSVSQYNKRRPFQPPSDSLDLAADLTSSLIGAQNLQGGGGSPDVMSAALLPDLGKAGNRPSHHSLPKPPAPPPRQRPKQPIVPTKRRRTPVVKVPRLRGPRYSGLPSLIGDASAPSTPSTNPGSPSSPSVSSAMMEGNLSAAESSSGATPADSTRSLQAIPAGGDATRASLPAVAADSRRQSVSLVLPTDPSLAEEETIKQSLQAVGERSSPKMLATSIDPLGSTASSASTTDPYSRSSIMSKAELRAAIAVQKDALRKAHNSLRAEMLRLKLDAHVLNDAQDIVEEQIRLLKGRREQRERRLSKTGMRRKAAVSGPSGSKKQAGKAAGGLDSTEQDGWEVDGDGLPVHPDGGSAINQPQDGIIGPLPASGDHGYAGLHDNLDPALLAHLLGSSYSTTMHNASDVVPGASSAGAEHGELEAPSTYSTMGQNLGFELGPTDSLLGTTFNTEATQQYGFDLDALLGMDILGGDMTR